MNVLMKKKSSLLSTMAIVFLIVSVGCGKDEGEPADPLAVQAAKLQDTWTLTANSVKRDKTAQSGWDSFKLEITNATKDGGNFKTTGVPAGFTGVWPAAGTWTFEGGKPDMVKRSDNIVIEISSVTDTALTLGFTVPKPVSRTELVEGDWTFTFTGT